MSKHRISILVVLPLLFAFLFLPLSSVAEKPSKKPTQKEGPLDSSNLQAAMSKAAEYLKKGNEAAALRTYLKIHEFTGEVVATVRIVQQQYEPIVKNTSTDQGLREDLIIKLGRMAQLVTQYSDVRDTAGYYIGYIYASKGDTDKARHYLSQVLGTTPFSTDKNSLWMKSKHLLLNIYNLEGEF